jgi:L-serine dehydratase
MQNNLYPDYFNDVFAPIMQPGSSSNFAGTSRVGRIARHLLKSRPKEVRFLFEAQDRDFAAFGNMMEDRGYLGGLLDFAPDDFRLYNAHALARAEKISYEFAALSAPAAVPGSVRIELKGRGGEQADLVAKSVGGGRVTAYRMDGFNLLWQADTYAVLVVESSGGGAVSARGFEELYGDDFLSAERLTREDGGAALFVRLSRNPDEARLYGLLGPGANVRVLPALLPIVTSKKRRPQLFKTAARWREVMLERKLSFFETALAYEEDFSGWDTEKILAGFLEIADLLDKQIHSLENIGYDKAEATPLQPIYGKQWNAYINAGSPVCDPLTRHILTHAFSVNAKIPGVKIVPGPMGTGGGYIFSALDAVRRARGCSHQKMIEGLVIAAALGAIAYTHTSASGDAGCGGESGVCCAMASGAIVQMLGGDANQVENAASMALQANIGIPCDPIPGGQEFPCITRTFRAAVTAPMYADLALCGIDPLVPFHEVLQVLEHMRVTQSHFLCSPSCGLNAAPTAAGCKALLCGDIMKGKMKYTAQ